MVHVKQYVSQPDNASKRWLAGELRGFYLRSLLPDNMFSKMNGPDRYTEVYFMTFDENIYKIFYEQEGKRLVMVSGDDSVYCSFSSDEAEEIELKQSFKFLFQSGETEPIAKIQGVATLKLYDAGDSIFEGLHPALLPSEFARQQAIVRKKVV